MFSNSVALVLYVPAPQGAGLKGSPEFPQTLGYSHRHHKVNQVKSNKWVDDIFKQSAAHVLFVSFLLGAHLKRS